MPRSGLGLLVLAALLPRPATALTDEEVFRDFRFNLINPGARSLALGGAFISLADDATAAQANPAGLSFLRKPEYFVELRAVDNAAQSSVFTESLPAGVDTFVATGTDLDDSVGPSFLSAVTTYDRWTMGVSRQELLDIGNATLSSLAFTFTELPGAFLQVGEGRIDVEVNNINVSVGVRASDRMGVGATLTYSRLEVRSRVVNMVVDTGGLFGEEILEPVVDLRTGIDDDDDDVVFSLGWIYKHPGKWHVGAVFRRGPRFSVPEEIAPFREGGDGESSEGIDLSGVRDRLGARFTNRFSLPDSFGVGGTWIPLRSERLTLSMDVERILYSNLLSGYVAGVNVLTDADAEFEIDDATNFRFGAEYVLFNENNPLPPLALRAGTFTESDSTIRARSTGSDNLATPEVFGGRGGQYHGAVGLGINLRRYKIDIGADFAESDNEYVISIIYQGK